MTTDELATLSAVRNAIDLAGAETAALACTPDEAALVGAELDAWQAAPLPLSIERGPRPIA